jgi:hypothetical protein
MLAVLILIAALLVVLIFRLEVIVSAMAESNGHARQSIQLGQIHAQGLQEISVSVASLRGWGPDLGRELDYRNARRDGYRSATLGQGDMLRFYAGDAPTYSKQLDDLKCELRKIQDILAKVGWSS